MSFSFLALSHNCITDLLRWWCFWFQISRRLFSINKLLERRFCSKPDADASGKAWNSVVPKHLTRDSLIHWFPVQLSPCFERQPSKEHVLIIHFLFPSKAYTIANQSSWSATITSVDTQNWCDSHKSKVKVQFSWVALSRGVPHSMRFCETGKQTCRPQFCPHSPPEIRIPRRGTSSSVAQNGVIF